MALINFYTLIDSRHEQDDARLLVACRICEKAFAMGHRIYVHTDSPSESKRLDDLLWQFKSHSFLPHTISQNHDDEPIVISHQLPLNEFTEVLINLSEKTIGNPSHFSRLNEMVGPGEASLNAGRSRYRHYQSQGIAIDTHKI